MCVYECVRVYVFARMRTYVRACVRAHMCACVCVFVRVLLFCEDFSVDRISHVLCMRSSQCSNRHKRTKIIPFHF